MAWQRGPAAQGHHDIFLIPLLTRDPPPNAQPADTLVRAETEESLGAGRHEDLVYLATDVTETLGTQQVAVAFDPNTLFQLCANLAEKSACADGAVAVSLALPCSPTTARRFQPWKDIRWVPPSRAEGAVSQLARKWGLGFGGR